MAHTKIDKAEKRARRRKHIRKIVHGTEKRPRLVVFRSNHHIYAQIVDDVHHHTIAAASTLTPDLREAVAKAGSKVEKARLVGQYIAERVKEKKISTIVFDRAGYLYHGRVRALAEGARDKGLNF